MFKNTILIIQTVSAITLTLLIFTQLHGSGIASGKSGFVAFSRRGLDKFLFKMTFVVAAILLGVSVLSIVI